MVQYKNTVQKDREIPQFWVSTVTANGSDSSQPVAIFYGDTEAEARSKGNSYISAQTSRGKQVIGDNGSDQTYNTLDEVIRAYNECKLTFREAAAEMTRINGSLSPNDIQDILVNDNPTPPDCDGDGIPAGEDDDGDSSSSGSGSWLPLSERNRFMVIGVIVLYSLRYYGRK